MKPVKPERIENRINVEIVEDEYYVTLDHPMTKTHYISFLAAVSDRSVQLVKLYPEEDAQARFKMDRVERIYACCNRHGLFRLDMERSRKRIWNKDKVHRLL